MSEVETVHEKLNERLTKLETMYSSDKKAVKTGWWIFGVLLVAFFGINFAQIGAKVDEAMSDAAVGKAAREAEAARDNAVAASTLTAAARDRVLAMEDEIKEVMPYLRDYEIVPVYRFSADKPYREIFSPSKEKPRGWKRGDPEFWAYVRK